MKRRMEIPERFELHGITYRVIYKEDLITDHDNLGEANYRKGEVVLQSVVRGVGLTEERQGQVFCHELVHHILRHMRHRIRDDEVFVDLFASLLHQALVSAEYPEVKRKGR